MQQNQIEIVFLISSFLPSYQNLAPTCRTPPSPQNFFIIKLEVSALTVTISSDLTWDNVSDFTQLYPSFSNLLIPTSHM